jgi:hypothetical protein
MAKKQKVNKSQAVREYLQAHPGAKSKEIAAALVKKGIKITPAHVATIKTKAKAKRSARKAREKAAAAKPVAGPAIPASTTLLAPEAPAMPANAITLDQIKAVGKMVKSVGGFGCFREMLDVIRTVGGLKRLRDILDAMAITEGEGK